MKNPLSNPFFSLLISMILGLNACGDDPNSQENTLNADTDTKGVIGIDSSRKEVRVLYAVILDSSLNYEDLRDEMMHLSKALSIPYDTMSRSYDPVQRKIVVPLHLTDHPYAGQYFPRLAEAPFISIEQKAFYMPAQSDMLMLIGGLFDNEKAARKRLLRCAMIQQHAHVRKLEITVYGGQ